MKLTTSDERAIKKALSVLEKIMEQHPSYGNNVQFTDPHLVKDYLRLKIASCERENFVVLFLDNQHQLIASEILFQGTIDSAVVHTREVIKRALELNANALILSHNHPSGTLSASQSDIKITREIQSAADLFNIRLLDHIIVTLSGAVSLAEDGFI